MSGGPAIEEATLGGLFVVSHHNIKLPPFAPRQRPAPQARRLKAQQERKQGVDNKHGPAAHAKPDHHDIEDRLEKAGVIKTKTDSECGEMYVYFDTKEEADGFYTRLWNYLRKRWLAIHDLKKQLRELP